MLKRKMPTSIISFIHDCTKQKRNRTQMFVSQYELYYLTEHDVVDPVYSRTHIYKYGCYLTLLHFALWQIVLQTVRFVIVTLAVLCANLDIVTIRLRKNVFLALELIVTFVKREMVLCHAWLVMMAPISICVKVCLFFIVQSV